MKADGKAPQDGEQLDIIEFLAQLDGAFSRRIIDAAEQAARRIKQTGGTSNTEQKDPPPGRS
jgi:hypothetical protein